MPHQRIQRAGSVRPAWENPTEREPIPKITLKTKEINVKFNLILIQITNYAVRSICGLDTCTPRHLRPGQVCVRCKCTPLQTHWGLLDHQITHLPSALNHAGGRLNMRFTRWSNGSATFQSSNWTPARCTSCKS